MAGMVGIVGQPSTIHCMSSNARGVTAFGTELPRSELPSYAQAALVVAGRAAQRSLAVEQVSLGKAAGRVLAQSVLADRDQPPFARSTRDGFACRAREASTHAFLKLAGATRAGEAPAGPLPAQAAWEIMTGAPVPAGADAVVMVEHGEKLDGRLRLLPERTIAPGENIVAEGAEARRGEQLLAAGAAITYAQIALAASCGYAELKVFRRPRVAILTTGDELVAVPATPGPGQIRNSNAPMLAALVAEAGGDAWVLETARDEARDLDRLLAQAATADMILISGGVSAGTFDLVEPALERMGACFHFTGVRIQPGKPLVFGELSAGAGTTVPIFGLPGNPVSSAVTFVLFASPTLAALAGRRDCGPRFAVARLARQTDRRGRPGLTRFLPAHCDFGAGAGELPTVDLVRWQGSGDLAALARSNCFLVIPEEVSGIAEGEMVRILLS
jgi:molybdopterin molybdotransferase